MIQERVECDQSPGVRRGKRLLSERRRMSIDPRRIELLDPFVLKTLQSKTPEERLQMVFECNRTARKIMAGGLRNQHPDWTEEQIQAEIARRMADGAV